MSRRRYSDNDRAAVLATLDANGGDLSKTARDTGVPITTIANWRDGRVSHDVPELRSIKRAELSDRLEDIAHRILDVLPDKLQDADLRQSATALGIAIDKRQLLTGQPTDINKILSDDERAERIAELLERARARGTGSATLKLA